MKKDNIVILKENNQSIDEEAYKSLARALINLYGVEVCKLTVEKFKDEEDKYSKCITKN